ncbi:MAG TPA: hypothetical protein VD866_28120, partial [Urbifossiella sp.]|nr:hypothetical protein [Urbifossiella sp.]
WLDACNAVAEVDRHKRQWPRDASQWGKQVVMLQPALPAVGLEAQFRRVKGERLWRVAIVPGGGATGPQSSPGCR